MAFKKQTSTKNEGFYHKVMKQLIFKYISKSSSISRIIKEKYIRSRRADVFIQLKSGEQIIVELQHSSITIKEIIERTEDYNKAGVYVLWILHAKGKCVAEPRSIRHKKHVRISPAENFLHKMYGGRVYYIDFQNRNKKVTPPFALHFSYSNRTRTGIFYKNFTRYYIRDQNYALIPNWNLFPTRFKNFKIARFYDNQVQNDLIMKISDFLKLYLKNKDVLLNHNSRKYTKRIIKLIYKKFQKYYGKPLILSSLKQLSNSFHFNTDIINKKINKVIIRDVF
ncbi:MAG: competence protein CoiA family protein [Promethearchaeota archaeon]